MPDRESTIARTTYPAVRFVMGFLFACHGASALFDAPHVAGMQVQFGEWPGWWAAVIELVCGSLVAVGLATRVSAVLCSGTMAYAYFVVHQKAGALPIQNKGEPAALFSWIFLLVAALGPGAFALDTALRRRRHMSPGAARHQASTVASTRSEEPAHRPAARPAASGARR